MEERWVPVIQFANAFTITQDSLFVLECSPSAGQKRSFSAISDDVDVSVPRTSQQQHERARDESPKRQRTEDRRQSPELEDSESVVEVVPSPSESVPPRRSWALRSGRRVEEEPGSPPSSIPESVQSSDITSVPSPAVESSGGDAEDDVAGAAAGSSPSSELSSVESGSALSGLIPAIGVVIPTVRLRSPSRERSPSVESLATSRSIGSRSSRRSRSRNSNVVDQHPSCFNSEDFPVDVHEIRAERGRYPRARKTNPGSFSVVIPVTQPLRITSTPLQRQQNLREEVRRKLARLKGPPVTLAPNIGSRDAGLTSNFEFIDSYILRKGVKKVEEGFNAGCDCGEECDPQRCMCLSLEVDSDARIVSYRRQPDGQLVLAPDFINKKSMIYECSENCSCGPDCWNRLVQHGRTAPLEIFHTGNRGFGLRSPEFIRAGQFIDCYLGEVLTREEADLRGDAAAEAGNGSSYLFALDFLPAQDYDDKGEPQYYVVDAGRFGSPARFINHSCNPNCRIVPTSTSSGDDRLYYLAVFAIRDIPPMTELTFDYNPEYSSNNNNTSSGGIGGSSNEDRDPSAMRCLCGEPNCRGQLWPSQRKATKND